MSSPSKPLALAELNIPGRTGPVSETPLVWGINIAAALDNFPLNGLLCQAGPWGNMAIGDKLTIYWGIGQNVWVETVDQTEVNTQLRMFVPSRHLVDGPFAVSYGVKPLGGTEQPSEVMQVRVKLTRPGGDDAHCELFMSIPKEIVEGGIDNENVAAGVPITIGKNDGTPPYPLAAVDDVCRISWGGIYVYGEPLTEDQAEGKTPIIVKIEEAIIREAGDADSPGVAVAFEVYDCVLNRSRNWSAEQRVLVAVDATRLKAPILKEARNNELKLDDLSGNPGTAQVVAEGPIFEKDDIIVVRVKGTPVEGAPIDFQVESKPLDNLPSVVELNLSNVMLTQLATTTFSLSYSVKKRDALPHLHSKSQFIRAIGEVQRLAAPVMLDEDSGALDPTLPQIRLQIPFDKSFVEGQALRIFMLGTTPELKPYLPDLPLRPITHNDIVAAEPLLYNIDGKHLAPVNGGTAEFYYQQLIADAALARLDPFETTRAVRESIHTQILQVGEPRLELPQPVVAGVVDGVLPADTAGTTLTVPYKETVVGDEVFMFWTGSITGEYPDSIKLNEFTAGQEVTFTIPAAMIKGNEGGTVIARYEIKRTDGRASYAEPLEFSVGVALVIDTSTMSITGDHYYIISSPYKPAWVKVGGQDNGTFKIRRPSSGVPPYVYSAERSGVVSLDSTTGAVTSLGNGNTIITVRDALGRAVKFPVICSGVFELMVSNYPKPKLEAFADIASNGWETIPLWKPLGRQFQAATLGQGRGESFWGHRHVDAPVSNDVLRSTGDPVTEPAYGGVVITGPIHESTPCRPMGRRPLNAF